MKSYVSNLTLGLETSYPGLKKGKHIVERSERLKTDLLLTSMHFMGHYFSQNLGEIR